MRKEMLFKCRTATTTMLFSVVFFLLLFVNQAVAAQGDTLLVSVDSAGTQADDGSFRAALSADGRYVAFGSFATNLVADDTNASYDIFVHDTQTGATTRVSVDSAGTQADDGSYPARLSLSADGRYVAFESPATNLVADDNNASDDVFVHDTQSGATTCVSVDSFGLQGLGDSGGPVLSADGRYVAFESSAGNLVAGDNNGASDIFVHDTQTGATTRVSVDSAGTQADDASYGAALSADGRYVAFESSATNLVAGDTNEFTDVFVHDTQTGATTRVSVDSAGTQADDGSFRAALSADGRYVAFESSAGNLVAGDTNGYHDIFVHDTQTGATTRVNVDSTGTQANGWSYGPALSSDGRYVAFESYATNLVAWDTNGCYDIFVHDTQSGVTTRVSVDSKGTQADYTVHDNIGPALSSDGWYVAFESLATNLVAGDTNGYFDIFVHQFLPDPDGGSGSGGCFMDSLIRK